ncbi:hypothetical protein COV17_03130 [Candidatus Woesearchaeota archaeon CG10_big_fil_rev_8_21_14_0_10_36_11]|nr:MAG: hypothetical protein COV17_03130 [Candidatus Woesearchaeota archaeon CG10_big_fil_rev_8_21_14_0_10_36_11]
MARLQMEEEGIFGIEQRIIPRRKGSRLPSLVTGLAFTVISALAIANAEPEDNKRPYDGPVAVEVEQDYNIGSGIELRTSKPKGYIGECAEAIDLSRVSFEEAVESRLNARDPMNDSVLVAIKTERDRALHEAGCKLGCEDWTYQQHEPGSKGDYKAVFRLLETCGPNKK